MSPSGLPPERVVTVHRPGLRYAARPPFDPPNPVYDAVESVLLSLGLDQERAGSSDWNPLGELIAPGARVVIKPNLVASRNLHEPIADEALSASSTHGSVLRPVLDYAVRAAGPHGQVTVVDSPIEGCELERVTVPLGIRAVVDALRARGQRVRLIDLRDFRVVPRMVLDDVRRHGRSFNLGLLQRVRLSGDPNGYQVVDLGARSSFDEAGAPPSAGLRFHRSNYRTPVVHHGARRHEYSLACTPLGADVIIHLPKLKTHIKAGVTLGLKSVVGLTNHKYWLPHFTAGDPSVGGDEFDRPQSLAERLERRFARLPMPLGHSLVARAPRLVAPPRVLDGGWEGNDTLWRTVLDLNRALYFASRDGRLHAEPRRRSLVILDGIVAGEGQGPLGASPVPAGLLIGGADPALVDYVATRTMGFDPSKVPIIDQALRARLLPSSDLDRLEAIVDGPAVELSFRPPRSWPSLRPPAGREGAR